MQSSTDPSNHTFLDSDNLWLLNTPSKAVRCALVSHALLGASGDSARIWGTRAAACLVELAEHSNPLLPDASSDTDSKSDINTELSYALARGLLDILAHQSDLDAGMSTLSHLAATPPRLYHVDNTFSFLARPIMARLALEQRHDDMANVLTLGYAPDLRDLSEWLVHDGVAMDHPGISAIVEATLSGSISESKAKHNESSLLLAQSYPSTFYRCVHPRWRAAALAPLAQGAPTLDKIANLVHIKVNARRIASSTPENVELRRAAHAADPARSHISVNFSSWDEPSRHAAALFEADALAAITGHISCIATSQPALAARVLMDIIGPGEALRKAWSAAGLSTVDAGEFLYGEFILFKGHRHAAKRVKGRVWPITQDPRGEGKVLASAIRLGYADCIALSGASRETLQAEADLGARPTIGLAQAVALAALSRSFSEADALWLSSFASNPGPDKPRRLLKA